MPASARFQPLPDGAAANLVGTNERALVPHCRIDRDGCSRITDRRLALCVHGFNFPHVRRLAPERLRRDDPNPASPAAGVGC